MSEGLRLFLGIFIILLLAALAVFLIYYNGMTTAVFSFCLKRNTDDKWMRGCSDPTDKELYRMFEDGLKWKQANNDKRSKVEVYSGKIRLAADYYDFGRQSTVIILPPMAETSVYSEYYADLYEKAGFNVLLTDYRATGDSAGEYISAGFYESEDVLEWADMLNRKYDTTQILIHGISMGAVAALLVACDKSCPSYIKGIILDSIYTDFDSFFRKYMEKRRYNTLVHKAVIRKIRRYIDVDTAMVSPMNLADGAGLPALFLSSEADELSDIEDVKKLFEAYGRACGNNKKELVVLKHGEHGRLKLSNTERYDAPILDFTERYFER